MNKSTIIVVKPDIEINDKYLPPTNTDIETPGPVTNEGAGTTSQTETGEGGVSSAETEGLKTPKPEVLSYVPQMPKAD